MIDSSTGSRTFLIKYMKFITENIKYKFKDKIRKNRDIKDKFHKWFMPDYRKNKWVSKYIHDMEINFNLRTATKINIILYEDTSTNIFVKDEFSYHLFLYKNNCYKFIKYK